MNRFRRLGGVLETAMWHSRWIVVIAVVAAILMSLGVFLITTVDVIGMAGQVVAYVDPTLNESARTALRLQTIADVVGAVDGFLLAAVLLIFGLGLYELFISKIEAAEQSDIARRLLLVQSLDDLKDRLARVVLLILVVKFLQIALALKYQSAVDLILLAAGIVLVGLAVYLTSHRKPGGSAHPHE